MRRRWQCEDRLRRLRCWRWRRQRRWQRQNELRWLRCKLRCRLRCRLRCLLWGCWLRRWLRCHWLSFCVRQYLLLRLRVWKRPEWLLLLLPPAPVRRPVQPEPLIEGGRSRRARVVLRAKQRRKMGDWEV